MSSYRRRRCGLGRGNPRPEEVRAPARLKRELQKLNPAPSHGGGSAQHRFAASATRADSRLSGDRHHFAISERVGKAMHLDLSGLGDSALRLGLALLLGCAIGIERQWHQKMAGLRTNALVALGASGFVAFSWLVDHGDPTRIAAQVVTGIGFLGAGVILREGVNVPGLNTAATLWCSAMVGTFAGGGYVAASVLA